MQSELNYNKTYACSVLNCVINSPHENEITVNRIIYAAILFGMVSCCGAYIGNVGRMAGFFFKKTLINNTFLPGICVQF